MINPEINCNLPRTLYKDKKKYQQTGIQFKTFNTHCNKHYYTQRMRTSKVWAVMKAQRDGIIGLRPK